jgi:hypothetical protein
VTEGRELLEVPVEQRNVMYSYVPADSASSWSSRTSIYARRRAAYIRSGKGTLLAGATPFLAE